MSRQKIKELIHELQKPGADQSAILGEIVKLKKALGDKVADPKEKKEEKPKAKKKSTRRSKKSKKKD